MIVSEVISLVYCCFVVADYVVQIVVMNNCLRVLRSGLVIEVDTLIFVGPLSMSLNGQPNLPKIIRSGMN